MEHHQPLRILLVEDNLGEARLLCALLEEVTQSRFELTHVDRLGRAIEYVAQVSFDAVLLDLSLPDGHGLETLRRMREVVPFWPIVVLSGLGDEAIAVKAVQEGAQDYLVKGQVDGNLLMRALYYAIERKRSDNALRKAEELYRGLADNATDVIFLYSFQPEDYGMRYINPAFTAMVGYLPQEYLDNPDLGSQIVMPEDRGLLEGIEDALKETPTPLERSIRFIHKDGRVVYGDLKVVPILGNNGQVVACQGICRDVSEHRRQEEERERLVAELDAFSHTVAHDLKNPLASVIGYAELLADSYLQLSADKRREYVEAIARNSYKMQNIIDELLLLAHIRAQEVERRPLDMAEIVAESLNRLRFLIEEYRAEIILPEQWPTALGYAPWVEEVWTNYVSNALKYGGKPPRVQLGVTVCERGVARFWVRDNGAGLTPESQARLFIPFTQLSQVRAHGHGLGLSIVYRIVHKLGGEVGVESQIGEGSTFSFTLPLAP